MISGMTTGEALAAIREIIAKQEPIPCSDEQCGVCFRNAMQYQKLCEAVDTVGANLIPECACEEIQPYVVRYGYTHRAIVAGASVLDALIRALRMYPTLTPTSVGPK